MSVHQILFAKIAELEARINDLSPPQNSTKIKPDGMPSFDVKKRIEALEAKLSDYSDSYSENDAKGTYYQYWVSPSTIHVTNLLLNDSYISKIHGPAMFDGIYYIIPKMILLEKLTMISNNCNDNDNNLSLLPDISKISNCNVKYMCICSRFEFIPYLVNFPSLLHLEIIDHPYRPTTVAKNEMIYDYCRSNGILLLCK